MSMRPEQPNTGRAASSGFNLDMRHATLAWTSGLAVLALGTWLVCPRGDCGLNAIDQFGLGLAHDLRGETLDRVMRGVTRLGSLALLLPLAVLATWFLVRRGLRKEAGFVLLAFLGSSGLSHLTKLWVMRPRPDLYLAGTLMPGDWSFPSAHTMQITAASVALFLVAGRRRAVPLGILLAIAVLLVGLSRIYLQVHFPSDVLAGFLAGAFWTIGLHALLFSRPAQTGRNNVTGDTA